MISVVIPAFRADAFLRPCIASVAAYGRADEILVGVDGCPGTLKAAKALMPEFPTLRVFDFPTNNGPYPVRNTLAWAASGPMLIFFDADDAMLPGLGEWVAGLSYRECAIRFLFKTIYTNIPGRVREICGPTGANGVFAIRKESFTKLGGFRPWRCSADSEFHMRCDKEFGPPVVSPRALFVYRKHPGSLTMRPATNSSSHTRRNHRFAVRQMKQSGRFNTVIVPTFAPFTEVPR